MRSASNQPSHRELLHAKLDALLDESELVADNAQHGHIFEEIEHFFFVEGRKFLQETFQEVVQERVKQIETTEEGKQCPDCKKNAIQRCEDEGLRFHSRTHFP